MNVKEIDNVDSALRILETAIKGSVRDEEVCRIWLPKYSSFQVYKSELARKDEELRKIQKNMAQWKVKITIFASLFIHRKTRRENLP